MAANDRLRQTIADMGRSLGLVFAFVLVLLFLGPARALVLHRDAAVTVVDYEPVVRAAANSAGQPVLAPSRLPASWQATSARLPSSRRTQGPTTMHIGFLVRGKQYAAVEETDGDPKAFLDAQLGSGAEAGPVGTVTVGGASWGAYRTHSGDRALVRRTGPFTVVVTGTASLADLKVLAASLRPST